MRKAINTKMKISNATNTLSLYIYKHYKLHNSTLPTYISKTSYNIPSANPSAPIPIAAPAVLAGAGLLVALAPCVLVLVMMIATLVLLTTAVLVVLTVSVLVATALIAAAL